MKTSVLAYSYIRCSTPEQKQGDTERRQLEAARKYAENRGLVLVDEGYRDLGFSAFHSRHLEEGRAFNLLLEKIKDGTIPKGSTLIIENLDRLSRDFITSSLPLFMDIIRAGMKIVTLMDEKEYTLETIKRNPYDLMYSIMILSRGHEESVAKSIRITAAWDTARKAAMAGTKKITNNYPSWLELKEGQFRVLEDRANIVRTIFKMLLEEGKSVNAITRELNRRNILTFTGKKWFATNVKSYLRFPAVIGEYHPGKRDAEGKKVKTGEIIRGYYPAIVSEADFYRALAKFKLNPAKRGRPQPEEANLFSGLVKCGYCGGSMGIYNAAKQSSYVCWNGVNGGCIRVAYERDQIEFHVLGTLTRLLREATIKKVPAGKIEEVEGKILQTEDKITKLAQFVEAGAGVESVMERLKALRGELDKDRAELAFLRSQSEAATKPIDPAAFLNRATKEERLKLIPHCRRHIASITLYPVGNNPTPYRDYLQVFADEGKKGHQVFKQIRRMLDTNYHRFIELKLRQPIRLDNRLTDTLILGRPSLNIVAQADGSYATVNPQVPWTNFSDPIPDFNKPKEWTNAMSADRLKPKA